MAGKLEYHGDDITVDPARAMNLLAAIMHAAGCDETTAQAVAEHLTDASLCGVASHGLVRAMQYVEQFETRYMNATGRPVLQQNAFGAWEVHGNGGIGIPAMHMGLDYCMIEARDRGRPFDLVLSHWGADQTLELRGEPLANGPRLLATMRGEDLRAPVILFSAPTDFAERKREALGLGARAYCHRYEALFREIEAVFTEEP